MKVLIDLTYIRENSVSGITIYAHRLLQGIIELNKQHLFSLLVDKQCTDYWTNRYADFEIIPLKRFPLSFKHFTHIRGWLHQRKVDCLVKKHKVDIFLTLWLHANSLYTKEAIQVGVLHDAIPHIYHTQNPSIRGKIFLFCINRIIKKQNHIITISNAAKSDILKNIPDMNVPISVIYNSVLTAEPAAFRCNTDNQPYLLYVNTLAESKNVETLIKAFGLLKDEIPHCLVIKGKSASHWVSNVLPLIEELQIGNRIILLENNFSSQEMASLYKQADLFVSPSIMEGFGYTPIEAAMYGVPVITLKTPVLYETTQGLLNYYEPAYDYKALAEKIYDVINNKPTEESLEKIAKQLSTSYSLQKQAESFLELFYQLIQAD